MGRERLFIGKVAKQAGTNAKTIRYYEAIGLLTKPQRGENRYRLYPKEVVELLYFIRKAQGLGLRLSEIKEIIDLRLKGHEPCIHVRPLLERKIADLDQRLNDLLTLRRKLKRLLAGWEVPGRQGRSKTMVCPHIEATPMAPKARRLPMHGNRRLWSQ
jgi:DNA-binding transcriptional MerR regulator